MSQREISSQNFVNTKKVLTCQKIFNLKYSTKYPNILAACGEDGFLTIINTNHSVESQYSNIIPPVFNSNYSQNAIFGLEWVENDQSILASGANGVSKVINLSSDKLGQVELYLAGNVKRIKSICSSPYNPNLIASCGSDPFIFIWDLRDSNSMLCQHKCPFNIDEKYSTSTSSANDHIHPIGAFRKPNENPQISFKKKGGFTIDNVLQSYSANSYTGCSFFAEDLLISIEAMTDDIKFWDLRNMITTELVDVLYTDTPNKKDILKLDKKDCFAVINPTSYLYTNLYWSVQRTKMSSRFNTTNGYIFQMLKNPLKSMKEIMEAVGPKQVKLKDVKISSCLNNKKLFDLTTKDKKNETERNISVNKEVNNKNDTMEDNNINLLNRSMPHFLSKSDDDEISYYQKKIIEVETKRCKRGNNSLNVNHKEGKILISSMDNINYVFDSLFIERKKPIELKGHESSFYVKSVLSPCGRYVVSGSNSPCIFIWDIKNNKDCIKLENYHNLSVNAVDWGRGMDNFIASGSDEQTVMLWDIKNK